MRKALIAVALCAIAAPGSSIAAEPLTGEFQATPCGVLCASGLLGYQPCEQPFPAGSWDEIVVTATGTLLRIELTPRVDWDLFLCAKPEVGTNGPLIAQGANLIGDECDNTIGPSNIFPVGCDEAIQVETEPGTRYVVRAYNFADPFPAPYTIWGAEA